MTADELFKAGKLDDAIEAQIADVKQHPADHAKRLFLFELLAFAGDLERARRQVKAIQYDEIELEAAAQSYRKLIDAEEKRRKVFEEGVAPKYLQEPPPHVTQRVEALGWLRQGEPAKAAAILEEANEAIPHITGTLNKNAFESLRDCDDLFGSVLEVMALGEYYWVPLEQVEALAMNPPSAPRDLIWIPARLELAEAASGEAFLPALYPGTHKQADDALRLGRMTDWNETEGGPVLGVGLRSFFMGEDSVSILEWRELLVDANDAAAGTGESSEN